MISGPEFSLEAVLSMPEAASGMGVVCHPHPMYGGSMNNNVVFALCQGLNDAGFGALRFNFRGVGRSEGRYGEGRGEVEDVYAALKAVGEQLPGKPLILAGYSFGASVALAALADDREAKPLAGIVVSPPTIAELRYGGLDVGIPLLVLAGGADSFSDAEELRAEAADLADVNVLVSERTDHFWSGLEDWIAGRAESFIKGLSG